MIHTVFTSRENPHSRRRCTQSRFRKSAGIEIISFAIGLTVGASSRMSRCFSSRTISLSSWKKRLPTMQSSLYGRVSMPAPREMTLTMSPSAQSSERRSSKKRWRMQWKLVRLRLAMYHSRELGELRILASGSERSGASQWSSAARAEENVLADRSILSGSMGVPLLGSAVVESILIFEGAVKMTLDLIWAWRNFRTS